MPADQQSEPLTVRDAAEPCDVVVYVHARDGTGNRQSLPAQGRRPKTLTWCAEHFIAHGVCVDCTQEAGEIIYAS